MHTYTDNVLHYLLSESRFTRYETFCISSQRQTIKLDAISCIQALN